MNAPILNRQFKHPEDGWYNIEPKGEHANAEAGVVQVIDQAACESIVNRFNAAADAGELSHGHEMLIDHEHFKHDDKKETRAYGWATRMTNRADGVYAQIRWTATGNAAVDGGDYRFFSTEYLPEDLTVLNREKTRVRPMAIAGLTLTNCPNNRGGKPITNRDNTLPGNQADSTAGGQADIQNKRSMKQIAQRLGLSADASEEAILGELTKIENRATTAEAALTPLRSERDTLLNRVTKMEETQAESDLDAHGIKADDADRPVLKAGLLQNRESGLAFLKRIGTQATAAVKPLTNRAAAKVPGAQADADTDAKADQKKAIAIKNRAGALQTANPRLTQMQSFLQAEKEIEQEA